MLLHGIKVTIDFLEYLIGAAPTVFFNQPVLWIFTALAVIASVTAVTQGDNVTRNGSGAVWIAKGYPVVHSQRMPKPGRTAAHGATAVEVIKGVLPIESGEINGEFSPFRQPSVSCRLSGSGVSFVPSSVVSPNPIHVLFGPLPVLSIKPKAIVLIIFALVVPVSLPLFGIVHSSVAARFVIVPHLFWVSFLIPPLCFFGAFRVVSTPPKVFDPIRFRVGFGPCAIFAMRLKSIPRSGLFVEELCRARKFIAAFRAALESIAGRFKIATLSNRAALLAFRPEIVFSFASSVEVFGIGGEKLVTSATALKRFFVHGILVNAARMVYDWQAVRVPLFGSYPIQSRLIIPQNEVVL